MKQIPALSLALVTLLTACTGPTTQVTNPPATPTPAVTASPTPTEPSKVFTDWSKLTPYESQEPVYTRRYESFTDTLLPADDYGELIPFPGTALTRTYEGSVSWYDTYYLHGLMTREGEVVVDPVFTTAYAMEELDDWGHPTGRGSVLLLTKTVEENGEKLALTALADPRGRWCTGFDYLCEWDGRFTFAGGFPLRKPGNRLALVDPATGKELYEVDYTPFLPAQDPENDWCHVSDFAFDREEGWCSAHLSCGHRSNGQYVYTDIPLLFAPDGQAVALPEEVEWVGRFSDGLAPARDAANRWGYLDTQGRWAIPPRYHLAHPFENGYAPVQVAGEGMGWQFIDETGEALTAPAEGETLSRHGDYWYLTGRDWNVGAVYDAATLESVASPLPPLHRQASFLEEGWVCCESADGTELLLVRGTEIHRFPKELGVVEAVRGDLVLLSGRSGEDGASANRVASLVRLDGTVVDRWEDTDWASFQSGQGEDFLVLSAFDGAGRNTYLSLDGTPLLTTWGSETSYIGGGLIRAETEDDFRVTDAQGRTVFYWPIPQAID